MAKKPKPYDLERVYDEEISPLMTRIIAICKEHRLPMFATFQYANDCDDKGQGPQFCTTLIDPGEDRPLAQRVRAAANQHAPAKPIMVTTVDADGTQTITAILP